LRDDFGRRDQLVERADADVVDAGLELVRF
jgi:hypothetical protein